MKAKVFSVLAFLFWAIAPASSATVYNVNYLLQSDGFPDGSVAGSTTTDGTSGVLATSNILDWSLTIGISGFGTLDLFGPSSGNNSGVDVSGNLFTANAVGIYFNFNALSNPGTEYAIFQLLPLGNGTNFFLMAGTEPSIGIGNERAFGTPVLGEPTLIGVAAVPGPLVGAGLPGLALAFGGFLAWRRRRQQASSIAV
jgi:hypothetical protein